MQAQTAQTLEATAAQEVVSTLEHEQEQEREMDEKVDSSRSDSDRSSVVSRFMNRGGLAAIFRFGSSTFVRIVSPSNPGARESASASFSA